MRRSQGFSLIELLVVIGIISILIGLVLPVLGRAKDAAQSAKCLSQMRQIGLGTFAYVQDYAQYLPRSSHSALPFGLRTWSYVLTDYVGYETYRDPPTPSWWPALFNGLYRCPLDERRVLNRWSYGKNVYPELNSGETADPVTGQPGPTWWRLSDVPVSAATVLYGEIKSPSTADHIMAHFWPAGGLPEVDLDRHNQTANFAYADGHARNAALAQTYDPSVGLDQWNPAQAR